MLSSAPAAIALLSCEMATHRTLAAGPRSRRCSAPVVKSQSCTPISEVVSRVAHVANRFPLGESTMPSTVP